MTKQLKNEFVGNYVNDIVDLLIASAVSGTHAILIGAPGWGKTAIARQAAERMSGGAYSFTRVDPSTPPEVLRGAFNPAAILEGRLERVVDGTPYDPACKIGIIDEIFRGSDVLFDAALDVLDRQDVLNAPPMWSTANFVATGTRVEALVDRIGLWGWIKPGLVDVGAISLSHLVNGGKPFLGHTLPELSQIEEIRAASATERAARVVIEALENLGEEAQKEGLRAHPRRVAAWAKIMFSYSMYLSGSNDFSSLPKGAIGIMKYAWPATTAQEAATWASIAAASIDPVATAIEAALMSAYVEFKRVSEIKDAVDRGTESAKLGEVMLQAKQTLKAFNTDDPRIAEAMDQIEEWFANAVRGREVSM